jgi:hypothetical protein
VPDRCRLIHPLDYNGPLSARRRSGSIRRAGNEPVGERTLKARY